MAGHSHWAGIKHKKEREDKKRGKIFSKIAKQLMSASRRGGKDPSHNIELQQAIDKAKDANMPKDNVERAILKGVGELDGVRLDSIRYEGYGSGGAAVIVDALTDNRNRTSAEVRKIFDAHGGNLGAQGCVSWNFDTKGLIILNFDDSSGELDVEEVFDIVVEAGAEDFQNAGGSYELTCSPGDLRNVCAVLEENCISYESSEITEVPQSYVDLGSKDGRKILAMMEELEDHDDVSNVFSNFNLPRELVDEMDGGR